GRSASVWRSAGGSPPAAARMRLREMTATPLCHRGPRAANRGGNGVGNRIASPPPVCDPAFVARTVLIVDDHPSFRSSARAILEAHGFEVVGEAEDGAAALAAVAR